jgi:hypothetical protein
MRPEFMVHDADLRAGEYNTAASERSAEKASLQSFASLHARMTRAGNSSKEKRKFTSVMSVGPMASD